MQNSPRISVIVYSVVFVFWPYYHVQCGLIPRLPSVGLHKVVPLPSILRPNWWIDHFNYRIDKMLNESSQDATTISTVPSLEMSSVSIEDSLFSLGPMLQTLLDPSDDFAKVNYLMSPLSTTVLLAQLLIGTNHKFNRYLSDILKVSTEIRRREIKVIELTPDELYDDKLYNSEFHWKLNILLRSLQPNSEMANYKLQQKSALFYNEEVQLVEHFKQHLARFYQTELHPVNFFDPNSVDLVNKWTSEHTGGVIKDLRIVTANETGSVLLHAFSYESKFEIPFNSNLTTTDIFNVEPYMAVEATYFVGDFENILYAVSPRYNLVGIPYKNFEATLYILLPNGPDFIKYNIREYSENMDLMDLQDVIRSKGMYSRVKVKLPKIQMISRFDVLKPIVNYAKLQTEDLNQQTTAIYLDKAAENLKVSNSIQETYFSLTESGTVIEAAGTSKLNHIDKIIDGGPRMSHVNEINFEVDRPFVFFIKHRASNATLYWGSISDPSLINE